MDDYFTEVRRPELEAHHSPATGAQDEKAGSRTSIVPDAVPITDLCLTKHKESLSIM
jgi:hypothetical protein